MSRPLYVIAKEIYTEWPKVNYAAEPYLDAMSNLGSVNQSYYQDSGRSIVRYFLANAQSWRGDAARRIKLELKSLL
jgi:hypothetical protein